jgi:hypothetical protein
VLKGLCTLTELKTSWTLRDLYDAHDVLDLQDQLEYKAQKMAQEAGKTK